MRRRISLKVNRKVKKVKWIIAFLLLITAGLLTLYLWPIPSVPFDQLYAGVDTSIVDSFRSFRNRNPIRQLQAGGFTWNYIAAGEGREAIVFLHGMTGAHDIWWQQINALQDRYRLISMTYPPVQSQAALEEGLLAILDKEEIGDFNIVGTSLGGYFAQYLLTRHPERIQRIVLSNTFPPNDLIVEKNRTVGFVMPMLPEWLVISVFRSTFKNTIYPTSGNDELTLAFLNETGRGRMSKSQLTGRYYCVIDKFTPSKPAIPIMIIESDNDPLVETVLREQLKALYSKAVVHTFSGAGHFPYLNMPQEYNRLLAEFFSNS